MKPIEYFFPPQATKHIEWRGDGYLIAACGEDKTVKIYDRRAGSVVKLFEKIHTSIYLHFLCVREREKLYYF